jgi:anti-sigma regulatory factor (Ser/Thr protein kinase)
LSAAPRAPAVSLVVSSDTAFLGVVREVAKRVALLAGFDDAEAESVALAVDECATNVIKHAYKGESDQPIELHLEYRGSELRIDVIDTGPPAEPGPVPELDLPRYAAERRKGGLGVHLMDRIMDSVSYARAARRNVCSLVKRKDAGTDAN